MKKLLSITAAILLAVFLANNVMAQKGDDEKIPFSKLPVKAQQFIQKNFKGIEVTKCQAEKKWKKYDVELANGYDLEFNSEGQWTEIESEKVPFSEKLLVIMPSSITEYISTNFPQQKIKKVEREKMGYKVKVAGMPSTNVHFDANGKFTRKSKD